MPRSMRFVFVTKRSSPTSWTRSPISRLSDAQPRQSFSAIPSSTLTIGYFDDHDAQCATISSLDSALPSIAST